LSSKTQPSAERRGRGRQSGRGRQGNLQSDVAISLYDNLQRLEDTFAGLNAVLRNCPVFSNGERHWFQRRVRPEYEELSPFVKDVAS